MKAPLLTSNSTRLLPLVAALAFAGCADDTDGNNSEPDSLGTIPEVAAAAGDFDTLVAAVVDMGLDEALNGDGPFTVFAPTDAAFASLPEGTLEGLSTEMLTEILLYHVVADDLDATDVFGAQTLTTLLGQEVSVRVEGEDAFINEAMVTMTDIEASNGVIHVIDAVLMPTFEEPEPEPEPEPELGTIPEVAAEAGGFDILLGALVATGLDEALEGDGPFTVFAPGDAAFEALPDGTLEGLSTEELSDILLYHVVAGEEFAADVVTNSGYTTLNGDDVTITVDGDNVFVNEVQVVMTDIQASNGVIHVIEGVLIPSEEEPEPELGTIPEIAAAAGGFDTLLGAVESAGLADTLASAGPFTVFAPTDDAFAALPEGTLEALSQEELTDILLYHVAAEAYFSGDVVEADSIPTLFGSELPVTLDGDNVFVDGVQITVVDIEASNGVIHVIDAVLLPPGDIVTEAIEAGIFTTLAGALVTTGLDEALSGDGPFTVFAPTDDAFAALPAGTLESLTEEDLTNILLYHVVADALWAEAVVGSSLLPSLLDIFIKVEVSDEGVTVAGAPVSVTDIQARNGVIHVIDAVMLPPGDIPTVAGDAGIFGTLIGALVATGLDEALMDEGPFTVFAPTDDAFAALPDGLIDSLSTEELTDILLYHVASGALTADDVLTSEGIEMLNGDTSVPSVVDGGALIDGAGIIATDIPASNGVIHVIDAIILPPAGE